MLSHPSEYHDHLYSTIRSLADEFNALDGFPQIDKAVRDLVANAVDIDVICKMDGFHVGEHVYLQFQPIVYLDTTANLLCVDASGFSRTVPVDDFFCTAVHERVSDLMPRRA